MSTAERPIPFDENDRAQRALGALESGPKSTLELHTEYLIHPARQIWELRHWYGKKIRTRRLPNRVALYELEGEA